MTSFGDRQDRVIDPSGGANQTRVRAYNERLVLSLVRRHESLPKSEIARRSGLSPQTVSVIMRGLESDGLLIRGEPRRGRVGQPSIPMSLNAAGVFSFGLKIGRRSADILLMDFVGTERGLMRETFAYPRPAEILRFVRQGIKKISRSITLDERKRIAGMGVAMPFELWNWADKIGCPPGDMDAWRDIDFASELSRVCDFPVYIRNDATAACGAELVFGIGSKFSDFVYFFIDTFVGGGIVLNHAVYPGRTGNAGALGSLPVTRHDRRPLQLIDRASLFVLEDMLKKHAIDPLPVWAAPEEWTGFEKLLGVWINSTARALAVATVSTCSVIDFQAVIIGGAFPDRVKTRIVEATRKRLARLDLQGLRPPRILAGTVGREANAIGGASLPLFARYLLDQNVLFTDPAKMVQSGTVDAS